MAIRMTGMISGMDTESIVRQLIDAQKIKNKRTTDKQTLLTWKQDKWKELNTKLFKLYTEDVSKLRLQGNYQTKKVTSSNENLVTVTGGANAPEGAHSIKINQLASSQYFTSEKLGDSVTTSTKLIELGMVDGTQINIGVSGKIKTLDVNNTTTINDLVNAAKDAGLNANYDVKQGRFFISSKKSGEANSFTITTSTEDAALVNKRAIDDAVGYASLSSSNKAVVENAYQKLRTGTQEEKDAAVVALSNLAKSKVEKEAKVTATGNIRQELQDAIEKGNEYTGVDYAGVYQADIESAKAELRTKHDNKDLDFNDPVYEAELDELVAKKLKARVDSAMGTDEVKAEIQAEQTTIVNGAWPTVEGNLASDILVYQQSTPVATTDDRLKKIGLTDIDAAALTSNVHITGLVRASDSEIVYNGAILKGDSNVISANGLTMTLKGESLGETISLNVANNVQGTYDMIKNFVKNYNEILKEMNTLFGAPSTRGFDPLSDDERESMTDDQIEKWETKIKDSILRRDSTLGSLGDTMRTSLMTSVDVDGKKYSLSSYGIVTSSDYTEKGLLHIQGNKDDAVYSAMSDKLMKALEEDPDTVMKVLSGVMTNLYEGMQKKMSAIPNFRSALTFYNDKEMDRIQTQYKKQVKTLEDKLTDMENKYFKQFAAMETALAKMQKQSNALAGMLGTSYNQ